MNKKQIEHEIEWLKEQLRTRKLTQKNRQEYVRQIRRKEIEIALSEQRQKGAE